MDYYNFESYRLSPSSGLYKNGALVQIPPKEMALLKLLVSNEGRTVSFQEIEKTVWPRQQVNYGSIFRCVSSLRKILGGHKKQYIISQPKRGYCFAAPIEVRHLGTHDRVIDRIADTNPLAYSEFMDGIRLVNHGGARQLEQAVSRFEEAIKRDDSYAVAYANIANVRMYQAFRGDIKPDDAELHAKKAYERALQLEPRLVSALCIKAWFSGMRHWKFDASLELLDEALEIDPSFARGYVFRAHLLRSKTCLKEAVQAARMAIQLDPHSLLVRNTMTWSLFCAGQVAEALDLQRAMSKDHPEDFLSLAYMAIFEACLGRPGVALTAARKSSQLANNHPSIESCRAYVLGRTGRFSEARELADSLYQGGWPRVPRPQLAMTYATLGDTGRVVQLLREARSERCPWFPLALSDPRLEDLRAHPEILELYRN